MHSVLVLELVILVLEANHQYSYSKILKASTRYSYSNVEYSTPSLSQIHRAFLWSFFRKSLKTGDFLGNAGVDLSFQGNHYSPEWSECSPPLV